MVAHPKYDAFKWTLIDHIAYRQTIGFAYNLGAFFEDVSEDNRDALVRNALLELFDERRIFAFRVKWDDAWSAPAGEQTHLDRTSFESALVEFESEEDPPDAVVLELTPQGDEAFNRRPQDVIPESGEIPARSGRGRREA